MSGDKLSHYFPNAEWAWSSESDHSTLVWFGPGEKPTAAEVDALEWPVVTDKNINAERERRLAAGSSFTVAGVVDPIPLQGRPFDQTVYLALLTRAGGLKSAGVTAPSLTLRDGADTIHELTPDQMIDLVSQSMTWFESVMKTSWAMKDGAGPFETGTPADYTADTHWPE